MRRACGHRRCRRRCRCLLLLRTMSEHQCSAMCTQWRRNGFGMGSDRGGAQVQRAVFDMLRSIRIGRRARSIAHGDWPRTSAQVAHTVQSAHTHRCKCTMVYLPLTSQSEASRSHGHTQTHRRHPSSAPSPLPERERSRHTISNMAALPSASTPPFRRGFGTRSPMNVNAFIFYFSIRQCRAQLPCAPRSANLQSLSRIADTQLKTSQLHKCTAHSESFVHSGGWPPRARGRAARICGSGFAVRQSVLCYVGLPVYFPTLIGRAPRAVCVLGVCVDTQSRQSPREARDGLH